MLARNGTSARCPMIAALLFLVLPDSVLTATPVLVGSAAYFPSSNGYKALTVYTLTPTAEVSWSQALSFCPTQTVNGISGASAVVRSAAENEFVVSTVTTVVPGIPSTFAVFTGGGFPNTAPPRTGYWYSTGEYLCYNDDYGSCTSTYSYTNFLSGQPNDAGDNEPWLEFFITATDGSATYWNDNGPHYLTYGGLGGYVCTFDFPSTARVPASGSALFWAEVMQPHLMPSDAAARCGARSITNEDASRCSESSAWCSPRPR